MQFNPDGLLTIQEKIENAWAELDPKIKEQIKADAEERGVTVEDIIEECLFKLYDRIRDPLGCMNTAPNSNASKGHTNQKILG